MEDGQGFSRAEQRQDAPQKAEVARADPQLGSQVRPMSLASRPWTWSISRSWRMLTVPLGGQKREGCGGDAGTLP